jgi:hypothetical protein
MILGLAQCPEGLCQDAITKPLTHDREAVGMAKQTNDRRRIAMSLPIFGKT